MGADKVLSEYNCKISCRSSDGNTGLIHGTPDPGNKSCMNENVQGGRPHKQHAVRGSTDRRQFSAADYNQCATDAHKDLEVFLFH